MANNNNIIIQFTESEFKEILKNAILESINETELNKKAIADKLFSIKEAAHFLNLAPQTLYGFTSNNKIPFIKKGKKLYFKKSELEFWLNDGRKRTVKEITSGILKLKGGKYE